MVEATPHSSLDAVDAGYDGYGDGDHGGLPTCDSAAAHGADFDVGGADHGGGDDDCGGPAAAEIAAVEDGGGNDARSGGNGYSAAAAAAAACWQSRGSDGSWTVQGADPNSCASDLGGASSQSDLQKKPLGELIQCVPNRVRNQCKI